MTSFLVYNGYTGFGYIIGTAISNPQLVVIMTPLVVVPSMLLTGFFVSQDNIPKVLWWLRETAIFKYGYQALMLNEFEEFDIACMKTNDPKDYCDPLGDFDSPQGKWVSIVILACLWIVNYFIAYMIMRSMSGKYQ